MKHGIYWLASYPKSGNTWTRAVITNYKNDSENPADINALQTDSIASDRFWFDDVACLPSSDLTKKQIELYQPSVYNILAKEAKQDLYIKVHDAYTLNSEGVPLFPSSATKGVLYLVRNPLDVVVSFAHHSSKKIAESYLRINNESFTLDVIGADMRQQLPQRLKSWSSHVRSWTDSGLPLHVVRYEDMVADPQRTFYGIMEFLGFDMDSERLERALRHSDFKELKKQESEKGFREKAPKSKAFFRKGEIGSYREELTQEQIDVIVEYNREVMQQFGYLDDAGNLLV